MTWAELPSGTAATTGAGMSSHMRYQLNLRNSVPFRVLLETSTPCMASPGGWCCAGSGGTALLADGVEIFASWNLTERPASSEPVASSSEELV
eukprot:scaffold88002_cov31-Attheya_sp.AAC.1